jgi:hypothetical protein
MIPAESLVGTLVGLATSLNLYAGTLSKASSSRRVEIARYLDDISHTLKEMSDDARAGSNLDRHCSALRHYLSDLSAVFQDTDPETFQALNRQLSYASLGRQQIGLVPYSVNANIASALREIDEACGTFRATASRLRVTDNHRWWQFWKR